MDDVVRRTPTSGREIGHAGHQTLEKAARLGYAARGVVYLIIGGLALVAAFGQGGSTTDSQGALRVVLSQPFGRVLLCIVALGLLGYAAWRIVMGVRDPESRVGGGGFRAVARRVGNLSSGIANLALAAAAGSLALPGVLPEAGGSGGGGGQGWTAQLMAQPFGRWLVALAGLAVIAVAVGFIARAVRASYERHFDPAACTPGIRALCRTGIVARGVVFLMIGGFLLLAAWQADPSQAKGLGESLDALERQPFGWVLLAVVSAGLMAYGVYSFIACRWRRIQTG